jgi:hypothetical protein
MRGGAEAKSNSRRESGRKGVDYCRRDVVGSADGVEACPAGTRAATDRWDPRVYETVKAGPAKSGADARPY